MPDTRSAVVHVDTALATVPTQPVVTLLALGGCMRSNTVPTAPHEQSMLKELTRTVVIAFLAQETQYPQTLVALGGVAEGVRLLLDAQLFHGYGTCSPSSGTPDKSGHTTVPNPCNGSGAT